MFGKLNLVFLLVAVVSSSIGHHMDGHHEHDHPTSHFNEDFTDVEEMMDEHTLEGYVNKGMMDKEMFDRILHGIDGDEKHPLDLVGLRLGNDLIDLSREVIRSIGGRQLSHGDAGSSTFFCRTFCLEFYTFCKNVCSDLIRRDGVSAVEIFPCLSTCTMQTAVCCFSQTLNIVI